MLSAAFWLACAPRAEPQDDSEPRPPSADQGCPEGMRGVEGGKGVRSFCMDVYEVTTGEYTACVRAGGCVASNSGLGDCNRVRRDDHPINCVTAEHAGAYCRWFGRRFPTGGEWSWAAHGGARETAYPWGDELDFHRACYGRSDGTCKVGRFIYSSPEGLHDLVGNVSEWTVDGEAFSLRGGGWRDYPASLDVWRGNGVVEGLFRSGPPRRRRARRPRHHPPVLPACSGAGLLGEISKGLHGLARPDPVRGGARGSP